MRCSGYSRSVRHLTLPIEFVGEECGVVAKFYAEPTGWKRDYDPVKSMEREFWTLKKVERIIDVPRPVGMEKGLLLRSCYRVRAWQASFHVYENRERAL